MAAPRQTLSNPFAAPDAGASRAACETACLVLFVEAIMWVAPMVRDERAASLGLSFITVVLLATCYVRDRRTARLLGLRLDNLLGVIKRLALPLGVFVVSVVAVGWAAGTLRFGTKFYSMLLTVPLWALLQQYMLLAFANHRLRVLAGGRSAAATAAMFALLHFPNPILMIVCAAGGYIWAREYEREPNLFATALTHTLASAFLANSLPGSLLKNMVVGYNFFFR
ncbi:MAG TPA: CPBP family glutamic-type intramembrane protease [Blastocatellia bacterium]|nr:CPBP family glutamic-type intramembrane protease [Blastocatellia bacterium]